MKPPYWVLIGITQKEPPIQEPLHHIIAAFNSPVIINIGLNAGFALAACPRIAATILFTILSVLISARNDVDAVVPASMDQDVAALMSETIPKNLTFYISLLCKSPSVKLNADLFRERTLEPERCVMDLLRLKLPLLDTPGACCPPGVSSTLKIIFARRAPLEIVRED